mmetsp:Transcript_91238/g.263265  ORF Transcript_91238/g.263265 Transcript_91238/m.263265 type:complete len:241 (-) Transcript_91238:371-1093(-)
MRQLRVRRRGNHLQRLVGCGVYLASGCCTDRGFHAIMPGLGDLPDHGNDACEATPQRCYEELQRCMAKHLLDGHAAFWIHLEHARDKRAHRGLEERSDQARHVRRYRLELACGNPHDELSQAPPLEGPLKGAEFVQQYTEAPHIASSPIRLPANDLWRHVGWRADACHLVNHCCSGIHLSHTEITQLHEAVACQQHVGRLQVPVQDPALVDMGDSLDELRRQGEQCGRLEEAAGVCSPPQ